MAIAQLASNSSSVVRRSAQLALSRLPRWALFGILEEVSALLALDNIIASGENGTFEGSIRDYGLFNRYLRGGSWSPEVSRLALAAFGAAGGGTYLDVGANIGLTTVPIARSGLARCFAFEPHPVTCARLRRNLLQNGVESRVEVFESAVGAARTQAELWLSNANTGDGRLRLGGRPGAELPPGTFKSVAVDRADDLVASRCSLDELARPIFIKLDIQGMEPAFFAGAPRLLALASHLFTEFWPQELEKNGFGWQDFLAHIFELFDSVDLYEQGRVVKKAASLPECRSHIANRVAERPNFYCDLFCSAPARGAPHAPV